MLPHFDTLLSQAKQQEAERRLLFTFARAEGGASGSSLAPVMCLDRPVAELDNFAALVAESRQFPQDWDLVFVASAGKDDAIDAALKQMAADIAGGHAGRYLAFNRDGIILDLSRA
ncbi:ribonucleotide reductase subunit alpha [Massilia sp. TS11]|uniref:ribonucleotide reductase subunit alpha n=1 Tax=Massilia sp. TS11 TaxID=2908003 RepID=UPI001EDAB575|nr:ribonucleotide reductase subunit alpha [Massilia sp. TS11]MCG2585942.1 ribonucleotide reductase subunit alpha [Massilia sp. TS11]